MPQVLTLMGRRGSQPLRPPILSVLAVLLWAEWPDPPDERGQFTGLQPNFALALEVADKPLATEQTGLETAQEFHFVLQAVFKRSDIAGIHQKFAFDWDFKQSAVGIEKHIALTADLQQEQARTTEEALEPAPFGIDLDRW